MRPQILNFIFGLVCVILCGVNSGFATTLSVDQNNTYNTNNDDRRKIRLGFTATSTMHRQLLLTEDENATAGIDWGYDGAYYATQYDDMYWLIEGELFTIQGTDVVNETSNFPLGFHIAESGLNTIRIDALENIADDFNLYLYDNELNVYHNLRDSDYEFYSDAGVFLNRFALVFSANQETDQALSVDDNTLDNLDIRYNTNTGKIILKNPTNITVEGLEVYNVNGQQIHTYSQDFNVVRKEFELNNATSTGIYVIIVNTAYGILSKKVIIN